MTTYLPEDVPVGISALLNEYGVRVTRVETDLDEVDIFYRLGTPTSYEVRHLSATLSALPFWPQVSELLLKDKDVPRYE